MWKHLKSIWAIEDLRNKVLFTLLILLLYRLLASISIPLTPQQQQKLVQLFHGGNQNLGQLLSILDAFSGGSWEHFSIVAIGLYPYITAQIVLQLLIPIIPALQRMQEEGESGRRRFDRYVRLITLPIAFLNAVGQSAIFINSGVLDANSFNLFGPNWLGTLAILLTLTAGTMILVWFGEQITQHGIGNGLSIIIFAGLVSGLPGYIHDTFVSFGSSSANGGIIVSLVILLVVGLLTIVGIVYLYQGQMRVPVQYPTRRQVGPKLQINSTQRTYLPMQINSTGMIPLIFASSFLIFPALIALYLASSPVKWLAGAAQWATTTFLNTTTWSYWLIYFTLVVAFTYFYAHMQWQQQKIAEQLQKQGAIITGRRPGQLTHNYLIKLLNRITLPGALSLGLIAILPFATRVGADQWMNSTRILITVGVILDTMRQLNAQMMMHNYSGFLS